MSKQTYWEWVFINGHSDDGEFDEMPEANMDYAKHLYFDEEETIDRRRKHITRGSIQAKRIVYKLEEILTQKQKEVLNLLKKGLNQTEIAMMLHIKQQSVKDHISLIQKKVIKLTKQQ